MTLRTRDGGVAAFMQQRLDAFNDLWTRFLTRARDAEDEHVRQVLFGLPIEALRDWVRGDRPVTPYSNPTEHDLRAALARAGFRVAKNLAHPFLGPTSEDQWTLWCIECGRDSGFHWKHCSKYGGK